MKSARPIKLILNEATKKEEAKSFLKPVFQRGKLSQDDIIPLMMKRLNIANNTAITYYHMLAKELGAKDDAEGKVKMGGERSDVTDDDSASNGDDSELDDSSEGDGFETIGNFDSDEDGNINVDPDELEDGEFVKKDDPDRQGVIRSIKGARLVFKRENSQGLYDELWVYNIATKMNKEVDIKQDILAGTDIPPRAIKSPDGAQSYELSTIGNAQLLKVFNLPQ